MPDFIKENDQRTLSGRLDEDSAVFEAIFSKDGTFRKRRFSGGGGIAFALYFLDGMADGDTINLSVVRPLILSEDPPKGELADLVIRRILFAGEVDKSRKLCDLLRTVQCGDSVLMIDGSAEAVLINTKGWKTRGISEPENETVQQGPREGFAEAILPNLSLLRRKLPTPDLCMEIRRVGRRTDTSVAVCYLESLADPHLVGEVKNRLSRIDIDGILDTNYLNELIRDHKRSLFKTCGTTERPDVVASKLLEGRVALIVDGTPVAMTVPYLFSESFQSDEDYFLNYWVASIGRFLRYVCFLLAVSVPALYLALITFHQRLLPTFLLLSAAQSRGGVPFSSFVECLLLLFVLEILKETGARMPQNFGHTLGIIGGLVVGQAAVEARLVSAPMLIVVAVSGIAGLMIPRLRAAVFYFRLLLIFLAALLGIPGCFLGITILLIRVIGLSSFGVPYTRSLQTPTVQGLKDTFVRLPWRIMLTRPALTRNRIRQRRKKGGKA